MSCWQKDKRDRAFTLLELLLAMSIGSVVTLATLGLFLHFHKAQVTSYELHNLHHLQYLVLDQMVDELRQADPDSLSTIPAEGTSQISFQKRTDFSSDQTVLSTTVTYRWDLASGELGDGLDNNGNGLIDEGVVVRREGTDEKILIDRVIKGGLLFTKKENLITLTLIRTKTVGEANWTLNSQQKTFIRE